MTTERDMLDLLGMRYTSIRKGTFADRWVRAEHVRSKLGYWGLNYIADFIALDKWPGNRDGDSLAVHWHEVKVSRSDWLSELKKPEKSEAFTRYSHYSWLVVSDLSIVKLEELPEGWGLLYPTPKGLRAKRKAEHKVPEPLPLELSISIAGAAQRTGGRELGRRDAPIAYVNSWDAKCSVCGELSPCQYHQVRAFTAKSQEERLSSYHD